MGNCDVCGKSNSECSPSPFSPCSYYRCSECCKAKRVPLKEMASVLGNGLQAAVDFYEVCGTNYLYRYLVPTMRHYNMTLEEILSVGKKI
jgi:hypothetical protein